MKDVNKIAIVGYMPSALHAKRMVEENISKPLKEETYSITNPYNFELPFQTPITRRERRALNRKNKKN
ncbi:hypothetical protein [Mucilaginibacter sp.]|uniref:hypothetical protein n=1 Tax=Mucilaginibacter sp. TaxID=1882438 RepID=UPI00261E6F2F|nr:hypothetical protein [Mucilaginibacter sp.]MDB5032241.1 hypothetical protein [Mucilaginibacter sp.]